MVDNQDRLRHGRIVQHASVQREKAQSLQTLLISSSIDAEASAYGAHASTPSSSRRRQVSLTHASLPPSFRMRLVSPTQAPEAPHAPKGFGGSPSNLSLLPLYSYHITDMPRTVR